MPPPVNVNGPRYGVVRGPDRHVVGINNIELITDRPLELNLREIKAVERDYPDRAVVVSLRVPCEEPAWQAILRQVEETGADGGRLRELDDVPEQPGGGEGSAAGVVRPAPVGAGPAEERVPAGK